MIDLAKHREKRLISIHAADLHVNVFGGRAYMPAYVPHYLTKPTRAFRLGRKLKQLWPVK